jgi:hypothetical protein
MPSYISSSRRAALHIGLLVGSCAVLVTAFETSSNYLLARHSETYARVSQQYAEAVKIRPAESGEPFPVLMVGNSLLLDGVDVKRLQQLTSAKVRVYPIFLEATGYYDWFYGLQRLFREGARPQVVVLGVGVDSFVTSSVRQDYVPLLLFDLQESLNVASDLKMDRTATSNLVLAHSSVFWDTRSVIRSQALQHLVPRYRDLVALLKPRLVTPPPEEFAEIANVRLRRLRELCESHGAKLILLIPPTPSSANPIRELTFVTQKLGVQMLIPLDPTNLPPKYYQSDDLHLNSEGAALFTSALATVLPETVARESTED